MGSRTVGIGRIATWWRREMREGIENLALYAEQCLGRFETSRFNQTAIAVLARSLVAATIQA